MTEDNTHIADRLLKRLFPICRSITGPGLRQSLEILGDEIPLNIRSVASGEQVFDWTIPDEWTIRDAYVANSKGERVIDFNSNNLHVVNYSVPIDACMTFEELRPHLHTLPSQPDAIPYRTSYYKRTWGFCLAQRQFDVLDRDDTYTVVIDSDLSPGELNYAEARLEGTSGREYLFSTYLCHPSMANDNLSGPITAVLLYKALEKMDRHHTYRFVFVPETIGAIAYLARNAEEMRRIHGGFVLTTCGGTGAFGYKETFQGDHMIDRAIRQVFCDRGIDPIHYPFRPDGSDERQYSSPGFRIPVATITKDKYYEYDEYHTSLDDLSFVNGAQISESAELYKEVLAILESARTFTSRIPNGEVQLGRRGLYPSMGGGINQPAADNAANDRAVGDEVDRITWLMFLADGKHSLDDVASKSGYPLTALQYTLDKLIEADLIDMETDHST